MSLDKQQINVADWFKRNRPAANMDPPFPYIAAVFVRGPNVSVGTVKSPTGFSPLYYEAHSSIGGLPESLRIEL